jgi:hypothetical protein
MPGGFSILWVVDWLFVVKDLYADPALDDDYDDMAGAWVDACLEGYVQTGPTGPYLYDGEDDGSVE